MSVLPDVLVSDLRVVFCGTAAGSASAQRRAYYAGPGNAFWPTLFGVGLTPCLLEPAQYATITQFGLGLTDLAKTVSGSDTVLLQEHFDRDGLGAKMRHFRPKILAFTSKRAGEEFIGRSVEYGPAKETIGSTVLFVLPSPSGAARRYWSQEPWRGLAALARDCHPSRAAGFPSLSRL